MSLLAVLRKKIKRDLFTTPSHAQEFFVFPKLKQFYKFDISETDTHDPQKALEVVEKKAAKIYGTKSTHFLLNGSSSGVIAAVLACVGAFHTKPNNELKSRVGLPTHQQKADETPPKVKVLIWDNAHPSHLNSVKLAGAKAVFYELTKDENWGIYGATPVEIIENKLKEHNTSSLSQPSPLAGEGEFLGEPASLRNSGEGYIKAVIITSPNYEGVVSDIKKIKEICNAHGAFLIVDEAHGALYPFCDKLPPSAIEQGADFVIQSLHKTAGGLNPTALLHCTTNIDVKPALEMITTTSPSYPLLASIEKNINFLNSQKGRKKILELIENIEKMKKNLPNIEFYKDNDLTKILIKAKNKTGYELSQYLYDHEIEDERTNEKSTMLLCGIGTSLKKLKRLEKVLKKL